MHQKSGFASAVLAGVLLLYSVASGAAVAPPKDYAPQAVSGGVDKCANEQSKVESKVVKTTDSRKDGSIKNACEAMKP